MAVAAAQLSVKITADGADQAQQKIKSVGDSVTSTSSAVRNMATGALVAGAAAMVGIGVVSTKMAADFQTSMTSLVTGAGESQSNLKKVSDGVLQMAVDTGTSTKQLSDGLYLIESAGFHGADGLNVLKTAAEGAKVGNADLGVTANAVTTILTDYHMKSTDATAAMNGLVTTVASGKTHLQDLAGSMGAVLPLASSLHVSFPQVGGAIATMTNAGMSAQNASQNLANAMRALAAPNKVATNALLEVGLSAKQVSDDLSNKGLAATIQEITDAVGRKFPQGGEAAKAALKGIMGGATGLNVALMLGNDNMGTFKGNVDAIAKSMNAGGTSVQGWSNVQSTFNFKMDQAKATLETLGIKIGTALLPALGRLMDNFSSPAFQNFVTTAAGFVTGALLGLINGITKIVDIGAKLTDFFSKNHAALEALRTVALPAAGAIGGALAFAFYSAAAAAFTAAAAFLAAAAIPIAIGAAIGLAVGLIILTVQHWGEISKWLQDQWKNVSKFFEGIWKDIVKFFGGVGQWFQDRFNEAKKGISDAFGNIGNWFHDRWKDTQDAWGGAGQWFHDRSAEASNGTKSAFTNIGNWFHDRFNEAYTAITGIFGNIGRWFSDRWNEIYTTNKPLIDFIGQVFQTIWNIIVALFGKLGQWFHDRWQDVVKVFAPIGGWFHDRFTEAWNAVASVFGTIGNWFHDRWVDIQKIFASIGAWFHDRFTEAYNSTTSVFVTIGKWFNDRWIEIQKIFAVVGGWFHDRFTEAYNSTTSVFASIGKWFQDRWSEVQKTFSVVGSWFKDRFTEAWNAVVTAFTPIGNWFRDRWNDVMNGIKTFKDNVVAKFNDVKNGVTDIFHNMINGIIDRLNDGIDAVFGFINAFGNMLNGIAAALGTQGTIKPLKAGHIPHYASGTDSHPGGPAIVGERGRELVFLPKGSKVAPNNITEMLLSLHGGRVPGYADGIGDIASSIVGWIAGGAKNILDHALSALNISTPKVLGMTDIALGLFNKVKDWAVSWIDNILPKFGGMGPDGQPVNIPGTLASWIAQAMAITGTPATWANDLGIIAMHESGGNPNAINLTDSNAAAGHPSQGIMQTIPSTFAAYALPGHGNILNPIDNIIAGIRYIASRYGDVFHVPGIESLAAGGPYVGYADGINNAPGGIAWVGERGPELMYIPSGARIVPNSQINRVSGASASSGTQQVIMQIDGVTFARLIMPLITDQIRYSVGTHWM